MTSPDHAHRLFPHFDEIPSVESSSWPTVVERLLEDGDREDLRWLASVVSEGSLAEWLRRRGGRRLSRRSLAFWTLVFDLEPASEPSARSELWPL